MKHDELDLKILNMLLENSKYSYKEIAEECNVTNVTVLNRIKRLEEKGYITGYSINLDYDKLGVQYQAVIGVKVKRFSESLTKIIQAKEVSHAFQTSGDQDLTIIARFSGKREMKDFLRLLKEDDSIDDVNARIVLDNIKESASGI